MQYKLLKTLTADADNYVVNETIPACTSVFLKIVIQPAQAASTLRVMTANKSISNSDFRFHDLYLINAIGTGSITTLLYLFAGTVVPFAISKIGSSALSLQPGRIQGISLPMEATIKQIYVTGGIPTGSTVEIYGCTEE